MIKFEIKYSFAFEIYSENNDLRNEMETRNVVSFLQMQESSKDRKGKLKR